MHGGGRERVLMFGVFLGIVGDSRNLGQFGTPCVGLHQRVSSGNSQLQPVHNLLDIIESQPVAYFQVLIRGDQPSSCSFNPRVELDKVHPHTSFFGSPCCGRFSAAPPQVIPNLRISLSTNSCRTSIPKVLLSLSTIASYVSCALSYLSILLTGRRNRQFSIRYPEFPIHSSNMTLRMS
jgi:hypothetical protein